MKLPSRPTLPYTTEAGWPDRLTFQLTQILSDVAAQVNGLYDGRISAAYASATPPTSGVWDVGDEVRNSAPVELGPAGSRYIVRGWICVAAGTPGTWKEQRFLTGA